MLAVVLGFSMGSIAQSSPQSYCPKDEVVVKCRKALVPFKYTNMTVNRIVFKRSNYTKEISIPLYYDANYRMVFNMELLPKDIKVKIYDQSQMEKKRNVLDEFDSSEKQHVFEPDMEANKGLYEVYVNFLIPAYIADDGSSFIKGCVVLMTGYEDEVSEEFGDSGDGE